MTDPGMITKIIFNLITINIFLIILISSVQTAPTPAPSTVSDPQIKENLKNCSEEYDLVDQRQNGTENYRINIKDVVLIWAPVNSLFAATSLLDPQILGFDLETDGDNNNNSDKPVNEADKPEIIMEESKPLAENSNSSGVSEKRSADLDLSMFIRPTTEIPEKPRRNKYHYAGDIGPLLRRKFQKH